MRWLAVDLGTRRVGLAAGDDQTRLASPLDVLQVRNPQDALTQVLKAIDGQGVDGVLVGAPLNMDGSVGQSAKDAAAWARLLRDRCGLRVAMADERLSSFDAESQLTARRRSGEKLTHARKKAQRDALAAAAFLQSYLDGQTDLLSIDDAQSPHGRF